MIIVMIKTMNVNMDVPAENPEGKKVERNLCNRGRNLIMLQTKVTDIL